MVRRLSDLEDLMLQLGKMGFLEIWTDMSSIGVSDMRTANEDKEESRKHPLNLEQSHCVS